ncbi:hypothetical protein Pryu01_03012 [Paraliobacillus ryukyuensis]|uniref:A118 family predicted phage portal protein n=1 Tax=Paraliobacillus ryukyuensis TaxID=200904 RepID=A0A366DPQ0_9BACI|nr:phage portal protein [Paraliobacillus ryukyuensis]RBO92056.1 A118 family predicted phage portal protein [Paraliobacillus ryukyuensis]
MFKRLVSRVREVLYKMGLLKGIKKVTQHKDIYANDEMYDNIDLWKALYKGYSKDVHDVEYFTIEKGKQVRRMMTLNMPKTVSEEMASLVFNEKCEINIDDDNTQDYIADVLKHNKFNKLFQDYLEYNFSTGGMVVKPYVVDDKIKLSFVTADCFIPVSYGNEGIKEGVFVDEWREGKYKYTHLEWHLWINGIYTVKNEVYRSENNSEDIGIKVPLDSVPKLAGIEEELGMPPITRSLFAYFKPNIANNIDTQSPLGISVYANAIDTLKMIDTMFDSLHREFKLGKKRILVPSHMVKTVVDPNTGNMHRYFNANDESYEAMDFDQDASTIQDIKIELRVDEHISAINAALNLLATQTGFSTGTFTFDGQSMKTATEVVSEQSKTFKTKKAHETIIEAGLQELVHAILELSSIYGIYTAPDDIEVSVAFDDSVAEDKQAELNRAIIELTNKMKPKYKIIAKYYGISEEEAKRWIQEINEENATVGAESVDFFGTGGGNNEQNS